MAMIRKPTSFNLLKFNTVAIIITIIFKRWKAKEICSWPNTVSTTPMKLLGLLKTRPGPTPLAHG